MAKKPFLGKGLAYPLRVGADGDFAKNSDSVDTVRDAITFLLHTLLGERPFRPTGGSRLMTLKHEPNSPTTRSLLKSEIENSILRGEPRVTNLVVDVQVGSSDPRAVLVRVSYTVIPANVPANLVFPFFLGS